MLTIITQALHKSYNTVFLYLSDCVTKKKKKKKKKK